jgi:hypothetical protein
MAHLLEYTHILCWLAFLIFLAVWCALAWNGSAVSGHCAPVYIRRTTTDSRRPKQR